jgi:hypothetical protein
MKDPHCSRVLSIGPSVVELILDVRTCARKVSMMRRFWFGTVKEKAVSTRPQRVCSLPNFRVNEELASLPPCTTGEDTRFGPINAPVEDPPPSSINSSAHSHVCSLLLLPTLEEEVVVAAVAIQGCRIGGMERVRSAKKTPLPRFVFKSEERQFGMVGCYHDGKMCR